jgi:hypothetical protein
MSVLSSFYMIILSGCFFLLPRKKEFYFVETHYKCIMLLFVSVWWEMYGSGLDWLVKYFIDIIYRNDTKYSVYAACLLNPLREVQSRTYLRHIFIIYRLSINLEILCQIKRTTKKNHTHTHNFFCFEFELLRVTILMNGKSPLSNYVI